MNSLLILHGALGSSNQLLPLSNILKKDFNVYTLDFSGHGKKSNIDEDLSIELFVNDIQEFLSKENITTPINIFGYSMGGYVALLLASLYPEAVNKIFTLATKFDWNEESSVKESKMLDAEKILDKVPHYAQMLSDRHGKDFWKNTCIKTAQLMLSLGKNPVLKDNILESITCECIISVGALDKMVSMDETKLVADKIKNAQFKLFENLEHPFEKIDYTLLREELIRFYNL
jgi:pimeloyl-ACP methyl ester carboxylesterase